MPKISIVLGTRPEIIKLSPIIRLVKKRDVEIIFSGQHYDFKLGLKFIEELGLPRPDFILNLSKGNSAKQTGEMIQKFSEIFASKKPDTVLVQGDTNTVLAGAIAGLKYNIPISHVEAGLRSYDWRMQEEHNRIATDHISELLFAPTNIAKKNLLNESVHGKIFVTGNTAIDAIEQNLNLAEKKATVHVDGEFALLTLHRAENVDDKKTLGDILSAIIQSGERIVFPIHPRTLKRVHEFGLYQKIRNAKNITMINAVGYFDILLLMKKCKFIISDSGGIQEEATSPKIQKKVLVVRRVTDRPESVKSGFAVVVGTNRDSVLKAIRKNSIHSKFPKGASPYGNGKSSEKIMKIINQFF